jgi:indole-3-glycerol phosphate synthase
MRQVQGTVLEEIISARYRRLEETRGRIPISHLVHQAASRHDFRGFRSALSKPGVRVIAEMKKASPSAGLLRSDYKCGEIAKAYQSAGAIALSILTEEDYFQGALNHLAEARSATKLPVLRKDFVLGEYQVYEAAAAGADAVLLIVAVLSESELRRLIALAEQLRVDALVEVHTAEEVEQALAAGGRVLGVNNRNLKTMEVDLSTSLRLREKIPSHCRTVSESGIRSAADVKTLMDAGFDAMLVGESLMRTPDPGAALCIMLEDARELLHEAG